MWTFSIFPYIFSKFKHYNCHSVCVGSLWYLLLLVFFSIEIDEYKALTEKNNYCVLCFRCERKRAGNSSQHVCVWDYDGTGNQYQILAGPVFILVYTISGIPLGFCAGVFHRRNLIVFCLLLWSAMTLLTGFATEYWHLVITRFILGIG